jgi:prefoldin subunit 5
VTAQEKGEVVTTDNSKIAKIQANFQALSEVAPTLNAASDELTKTIGLLDEALAKLNVGVVVWVWFRSRGDDDNPQVYDLDEIGYAKVNGTWGIAIRRCWGDEIQDWQRTEGPWLFNDASRELRLLSVEKIPDVIGELASQARKTAQKIQEKAKEVRELAEAIAPKGAKGKSQTLAERIAAGQKTLADATASGKLSNMATRTTVVITEPPWDHDLADKGSK